MILLAMLSLRQILVQTSVCLLNANDIFFMFTSSHQFSVLRHITAHKVAKTAAEAHYSS